MRSIWVISDLRKREVLYAFLCSVIAIFITSCSTTAIYKLEGRVLDSEGKAPLQERSVRVVLPGAVGLSASESAMPEAFGAEDGNLSLLSDAKGEFRAEFKRIIHVHLGMKLPAAPKYIVAVDGACTKIWGLDYVSDPYSFKSWNPEAGEWRASDGKSLELSSDRGECEKSGCGMTTKSYVTIKWDDRDCRPTDIPAGGWLPILELRRNLIEFGYGTVFSNSFGLGYSRRFFRSGFLTVEIPVGFNNRSVGMAALLKVRLLGSDRLGLDTGFGPQWERRYEGDFLLSQGVNPMGAITLNYSTKRGIVFSVAYSTTREGEDKFDKRYSLKTGLAF